MYSHVTQIKKTDVDMRIVNELLKQSDALEKLYDWIILPDYEKFKDVLPQLNIISRIQKSFAPMDIYRGIDPTSGYQDTMGLKKDGILWFGKLNHAVGDVIELAITKPLSFTDRKDIASEYGSTIIECKFSDVRNQSFVFTKELYYAISLKMNIEPLDVHEIIVLPKPGNKIKFTVVAV